MKSLQKLSYKTLFIILFLSLAGIVFLSKIGQPTKKISAAWWDEMWHYRKAISITNSSGTNLTDFQVSISIGTSQLIADGKMQTNCNDIRITDINGNLLPHWIEENNPGCNQITDTKVWFKINSIPTSEATVYIYYGNSQANNINNVVATFGPLQKLSLESSYTVAPSPSGSYPDTSGKQLTNGLIREELYQTTEATVGWNNQNPVITIDLNRIAVISSFKFYLGGGGTGSINIPTQINTKYSLDNSTYNSIGIGNSWSNVEQWITINNNSLIAAKYGQASIITNQWTMLGEMEIYGYPGSTSMATTSASLQSEEIGISPIAYWKFDDIYDGYIPLEYIQTSKNQYIDTGINPKTTLSAELTITLDNESLDQKLFGAYSGSMGINMGTLNSKWRYGSGNWANSNINTSTNKTIIKIADYQNNYNWYINNELMASNLPMTNYNSPIYLIGINYQGSFFGEGTSLKLYNCKFWDSGTLIRNFLPVKRTSDNTVGLYDTINNIFYPNVGNGSFTAGPEIIYDSVGNNHGTLGLGSSSPTWTNESQCISGKCLNFDGINDFIDIPNLNNSKNSYTFNFWIYSRNSTSSGKYFFDIASGRLLFGWGSDTAGKIGLYDGTWKIFGDSPTENRWHHIAYVLDGDNSIAKMYLNGKQYGNNLSFTPHSIGGAISIGSRYSKNDYFFNGYIDEVKIYPYARTANQIKQDYNSRGSTSGSGVNLGVQSNTAPSLKSNLVAYYKFDEGNGTSVFDSSGNNNTGVLGTGSSSPTWSKNGQSNGALIFDGNDSITLANEIVSTSSIRTNGITYSAWIKLTNINGTQKIVGQKPSSGYADFASGGLDIYNGNARMIAYDDNIDYKYATGNTTLIPNQWYLITGVYNPSDQKIKIYVNGKFDGGETTITTFNRLISNNYNSIGSYNYSSKFLNGLIDEVKIYNTALTDDQIKLDYNKGSSVQFGITNQNIGGTTTSLEYCIPGDTSYCKPPIAEWKMDEGVGTSIVDTSGNNNTGTLINTPSWSQGKIGKSLYFEGTDNRYVSLSNNIDIGSSSWTISGWTKIPSNTTGRVGNFIGNYPDPSRLNLEVNQSGAMRYYWNNAQVDQTGTTNLKDDKWHYLTWVRNKNSNYAYMYIDGRLEKSFLDTGSDINLITPFWIGSDKRAGGLPWHGQIDHIKIYNYARTPAQIVYDYNKGAPIGHWKLNECQGNIAHDSSGNNNHGTINIGVNGSQNSLGTCAIGTSAAWTNGANGKINSSLNFDGEDDYFVINQPNIQTSPNFFNITGWIKPENKTGYIITPNSNGIDQSLVYDTTYQRIRLNIAESSDTNERTRNSTPGSVPNDEWTHLAISIDDKNIKIYINGVLDSEYNESINIGGWSSNWNIGQRGNSTNWYKGKIDDLRVYNYVLTAEQIKTVYNNGAVNFQ